MLSNEVGIVRKIKYHRNDNIVSMLDLDPKPGNPFHFVFMVGNPVIKQVFPV